MSAMNNVCQDTKQSAARDAGQIKLTANQKAALIWLSGFKTPRPSHQINGERALHHLGLIETVRNGIFRETILTEAGREYLSNL